MFIPVLDALGCRANIDKKIVHEPILIAMTGCKDTAYGEGDDVALSLLPLQQNYPV